MLKTRRPWIGNQTLWYLLKELKTYVHIETCTQMCITALSIIVPNGRQSRCPSVGEWIGKLWYIQIMEYYPALKRNPLSSCKKTWKNLKCILLGEVNLKRLDPIWLELHDAMEKTNYGDKKLIVCQWWGGERWLGRVQRICRVVKTLNTITAMAIFHYTFIQSHNICDTRSEPSCKLWTLGLT